MPSPRKIRWLEWLDKDPRTSVGGAEVHLLSIARRLEARGVEVSYSSDPQELFRGTGFDVVRTHGATLPSGYLLRTQIGRDRAVRVHTLHGSAIGQMRGLHESLRFRHYKAWFREISGVLRADLVASIHPGLGLYRAAPFLGHQAVTCWNGWDSAPTPATVSTRSEGWAFIGRLWDRVKGSDRILALLDQPGSPAVIAVPGDGLPDHPRILKSGRLDSAGIHALLASVRGLVLPSRFEGLPLVVLEALAAGVPVVATRVGGMEWIAARRPEGLRFIDTPDSPDAFIRTLHEAEVAFPENQRESRALNNRSVLWTWEDCTRLLVDAVNPLLEARAGLRIPSLAE